VPLRVSVSAMEGIAAYRNALTRGLLTGVIVVGSLAFWTVVPIGWLYVTAGFITHGGARFVIAMFGCPLSMALVYVALSRVEAHRVALGAPPQRGSRSLLEVMLVVSAVIALVGLVLWWAFLADTVDPSGPLQPI
jgi:hypothetical protein